MGILVIPEKKPTMEDFKKIIDYYLDLHDELDEKIEEKRILSGWLWLDCRPFKHALLNTVNNWGWLYKNHLYEHVLQRCVSNSYRYLIYGESFFFLQHKRIGRND